jgi:hypothetical protein
MYVVFDFNDILKTNLGDIFLDDIQRFFKLHSEKIFICYDVANTYQMLKNFLELSFLHKLIDNNQLRDIDIMYMLHSITKYDEVKHLPREDFILTPDYYLQLRSEILEESIHFINDSQLTFDNVIQKYGVATEFIQIKGAIALQSLSANGMTINQQHRNKLLEKYTQKYEYAKTQLFNKYPDFKNTLSASNKTSYWKQYKDREVVKLWLDYKKYNRYINVISSVPDEPICHPIYNPMTISGKTSCKLPCVQHFPTKKGFREIFTASKGNIILGIDYNYIELCTLAMICEKKFGKSVLADKIRNDIDLHSYTAELIFGSSLDDNRKIAKAINFSIAGGQGPRGLQKFAKSNDIDLSLEECKKFRKKMLYEIYPELGMLLDDYAVNNVAEKLNLDKNYCKTILKNEIYKLQIGKKSNHKLLKGHDNLCMADVCTLTGRIRKNVKYTIAFNMPRAGLAADLAKLALWNLTKEGYKLIAFIHDEILLEIPKTRHIDKHVTKIHHIFNNALPDLSDSIPIKSKSVLMSSWSK